MTLKCDLTRMPMPPGFVCMNGGHGLCIKIPAGKSGNASPHFDETFARPVKCGARGNPGETPGNKIGDHLAPESSPVLVLK